MGQIRFLGGPSIFLLLLFLLPGGTSASTAEPQYVVLVPFLIHTDTTEKICVQLSHLNESVTLSITLDYGGHNESLVTNVVTKTDDFQCIPFMIPRWNSTTDSPVALLTVSVKGETLSFWSRKRVLVKNLESLVFVQTDKPIYKPGQEVHFRIASLDEGFHPLNEKFPLVYIQDPKRNRLYQWQDVELKLGLIQLSFPLTSEPTQGTYKVVVKKSSGGNVEHPFDVKEYVLPKYEVVVKAPKIITILSEEMEVTVCGMYTYGKPVPGLVKVRVCRQYSGSWSQCYGKESEAVCEEFSGEADGHGCLSRVVQTKVFQLKRSGYRMSIEVEGKIVEEGTGHVVCHSGPERRLFPRSNSGGSQTIPGLCYRTPRVPLQRPPIRTLLGSSSVYEMHGSSGRVPSPKRDTTVPLSRRLALRCGLTGPTNTGPRIRPRTHGVIGTSGKLGKVSPYANEADKVHRSHARLGSLFSVPPSGPIPGVDNSCPRMHEETEGPSSEHPNRFGTHGFDNVRNPTRETPAPTAAGLVPLGVQPSARSARKVAFGTEVGFALPPLVARLQQCLCRYGLHPSTTTSHPHYRRLPKRLGSTHRRPNGEAQMDDGPEAASHKHPGNARRSEGPEGIRDSGTRQGGPPVNGQYHCNVLYQQAGRHKIPKPPALDTGNLGLVRSKKCSLTSHTLTGGGERVSGPTQQVPNIVSRMETPSRHSAGLIPQMGNSRNRPVCIPRKRTLWKVLLPLQNPGLPRRCLPVRVERSFPLCLPTVPVNHKSGSQDDSGPEQSNPDNTVVAEATVAALPSAPVKLDISATGVQTRPAHSTAWSNPTSRTGQPPSSGLENRNLDDVPSPIRRVILAAHKPTTKKSYSTKWRKFADFLTARALSPSQVSTSIVLEFLMTLVQAGLGLSSIKCYLSAICAHYYLDGRPSFFRDPLVKSFLKGLNNLYPPVSAPVPAWSLDVVLGSLMLKPFEPMATSDLRLVTWKTAFLVAITSARRAGELCALRRDQPFIRFHRDKVVLRTDISFLPKVVSSFHMCQDIVLPTLASNPTTDTERRLHTLDVRRALAFYLDRTKDSSRSERLFQCYSEPKKGLPVSAQRFSKWIVGTVQLCYEIAGRAQPARVRAHATRAVATSSAFLAWVALEDVCKAAVWSQPLTFVRHYRLDTRARRDAAFGRAVLVSGLH